MKTDVTNAEQFEGMYKFKKGIFLTGFCILAAFQKTIQTWKGIDVLINNAGVLNDTNWELEVAINAVSKCSFSYIK